MQQIRQKMNFLIKQNYWPLQFGLDIRAVFFFFFFPISHLLAKIFCWGGAKMGKILDVFIHYQFEKPQFDQTTQLQVTNIEG